VVRTRLLFVDHDEVSALRIQTGPLGYREQSDGIYPDDQVLRESPAPAVGVDAACEL